MEKMSQISLDQSIEMQINNYRLTTSDSLNIEDEFFQYLKNMNLKDLKLYAVREGSLVFPRIPIIRIEGPLIMVQLLETTLLVLVNFAR